MKAIMSKSGFILTALLIVSLLAFGYMNQQKTTSNDDSTIAEKQSSNSVQSKLNLKGMTRHLLDFYK